MSNRTVLVTGAGGGIGREIVSRLVEDTVEVVAVTKPGSVNSDVELAAIREAVDVSSEGEVSALFARLDELGVSLDGVVTAAGVNARSPAVECSAATFMRNLEVNLLGTFLVCREAGRRMTDTGGSIVTISSTMAMVGSDRSQAPYSASKGGVVALTRALAVEWADADIRVNSVAPTFISTPMNAAVLENPELSASILAAIPIGRFGQPSDVAEATAWLLSDEARFVTGHVLPVDGGYLAK